MSHKTLGELAEVVKGELVGSPSLEIVGVAGTREARSGEITFVANEKYAALLEKSSASAAVVPVGIETNSDMPVIKVDDPEGFTDKFIDDSILREVTKE